MHCDFFQSRNFEIVRAYLYGLCTGICSDNRRGCHEVVRTLPFRGAYKQTSQPSPGLCTEVLKRKDSNSQQSRKFNFLKIKNHRKKIFLEKRINRPEADSKREPQANQESEASSVASLRSAGRVNCRVRVRMR